MFDVGESVSNRIVQYEYGVREKAEKIIDALIPLPCLEYQQMAGNCDLIEDCPSLDGEDPLCQTRRVISDRLAAAMLTNKFDPSHPQYIELSDEVNSLLFQAGLRGD